MQALALINIFCGFVNLLVAYRVYTKPLNHPASLGILAVIAAIFCFATGFSFYS